MPRTISDRARNEVEALQSGDVELFFGVIVHPQLVDPIRVVSESKNGVSYKNGKIVNYKLQDDSPIDPWGPLDPLAPLKLYQGCPFECAFLTDTERPPQSKIRIIDPSRKVGLGALAVLSSPMISFRVLFVADFTTAVDAQNARVPIGTPIVEYRAEFLLLKNVNGDGMAVEADIVSVDLSTEFYPSIRTTKDVTPALYR